MITSLSVSDLQYLKDLWDRSEHKPYHTGGKVRVGDLITTVFHPELEQFVRDKFEITGPVGGQLARIDRALSVHADVLFDLKIQHFTQQVPSRTQYVVIDTDAKEPMYTILFEELVNRETWTGFKDGTGAIIDYDETKPTVREQFFDYQIDHFLPKVRDLHIGFKTTLPLEIGEVVKWRSDRLHAGCSFSECDATYKLHLTVLTHE